MHIKTVLKPDKTAPWWSHNKAPKYIIKVQILCSKPFPGEMVKMAEGVCCLFTTLYGVPVRVLIYWKPFSQRLPKNHPSMIHKRGNQNQRKLSLHDYLIYLPALLSSYIDVVTVCGIVAYPQKQIGCSSWTVETQLLFIIFPITERHTHQDQTESKPWKLHQINVRSLVHKVRVALIFIWCNTNITWANEHVWMRWAVILSSFSNDGKLGYC